MTICPKCDWDPDVAYKVVFEHTFTDALLSVNKLKGNYRGARFAYKKYKQRWIDSFLSERSTLAIKGAFYRGFITRLYVKPCRPLDLENLVGGCKPLVDALKKADIIPEDNPKVWRGYYFQQASEFEGCIVRVERLV